MDLSKFSTPSLKKEKLQFFKINLKNPPRTPLSKLKVVVKFSHRIPKFRRKVEKHPNHSQIPENPEKYKVIENPTNDEERMSNPKKNMILIRVQKYPQNVRYNSFFID